MRLLVSNLRFASFLTYCPRKNIIGEPTEEMRKAINMMLALKKEEEWNDSSMFMSEYVVKKLTNRLESLDFRDIFGDNIHLVPVPKSSLIQKGTLWSSAKLASEMSKKGLGIYYPCLERIRSVNKAAYSR